jgi:hypothetical protein
MPAVAQYFRYQPEAESVPVVDHDRKITALVGVGEGPRVVLRSRSACVRIRGLTEGGIVQIFIDSNEALSFHEDGEYNILGGEFAKAIAQSESSVICDFLIGRG